MDYKEQLASYREQLGIGTVVGQCNEVQRPNNWEQRGIGHCMLQMKVQRGTTGLSTVAL